MVLPAAISIWSATTVAIRSARPMSLGDAGAGFVQSRHPQQLFYQAAGATDAGAEVVERLAIPGVVSQPGLKIVHLDLQCRERCPELVGGIRHQLSLLGNGAPITADELIDCIIQRRDFARQVTQRYRVLGVDAALRQRRCDR